MGATTCRIFSPALDETTEEARIGLINMWVDERGEDAFKRLMPPKVRVFTTRIAADLDAYNEQGRFVPLGGFDLAARTLPEPNRLHLIAFSCTSGTIAYGEAGIEQAFSTVHPGVPVTNPATAAAAGLRAAGVRRFALLTPYLPSIHRQLRPFFEGKGLEVTADGTFSMLDDSEIVRVSEASIVDAGRELLRSGGDALFISCTEMDVVDRLGAISEAVGAPVFSSAQLFAWHALELLGRADDADRILKRRY